MKKLLKIFAFLLLLLSFTYCANGRKLQEEPPIDIKQAYYSTWTGGVKGAASGITFIIPTEGDGKVVLDSVYFRGRKAALQKEPTDSTLYIAQFKIPSRENYRDKVIMHADPKEEYGNPTPEILPDIPFELKPDEAVVRYTDNGRAKYFKIKGIKKKDSTEVPIKNPQNIRH
ncbi:hypothetical protein [Salinimicrobium soli]|uniref:hypothetical protein n=1 Tax=Salinimicrobium soli TaxID=1254399 RepID=UPI003AAB5858